jgi:hypothetical protein
MSREKTTDNLLIEKYSSAYRNFQPGCVKFKNNILRVYRFQIFLQFQGHTNAPNQSVLFRKHETTKTRTKIEIFKYFRFFLSN